MTTLAHPTIFVPGWLGTTLEDEYRLPHEAVWSTLTRDFERATLHPDNLQFESIEPARVVPGQVHELGYKELIEELRHGLSPSEDEPVPVYAFKYDWRQPLVAAEAQLARFVEEVIERTKLLRHYDAAGWGNTTEAKVNLVGHSLGGVLIAGYLEQSRGAHHVHKVATLAAPFQGAFEAVAQITTGTANLGSGTPSSREREAARVTPGLYHMLGSFDGGLIVDDGIGPRSLFDIAIWQGSVIDTLERFIRRHGLDRGDPAARARTLFTHMLQTAATHRARIDTLDLAAIGLSAAHWLCVVGVNAKTRIRLRVVRRGAGFDFDFRPEDRDNMWGDANPGIWHRAPHRRRRRAPQRRGAQVPAAREPGVRHARRLRLLGGAGPAVRGGGRLPLDHAQHGHAAPPDRGAFHRQRSAPRQHLGPAGARRHGLDPADPGVEARRDDVGACRCPGLRRPCCRRSPARRAVPH